VVQFFADPPRHVVAMGERDSHVQRRHQKRIGETPAPAVTPEIRAAIFAASEKLARAVDYVGAGTIEYLLDADGSFYFLEMNTRIQVEHTVTEMVTGIDLVKEQIRVAEGQPLSFAAPVPTGGWAIECRINAEDAARNFGPAPGRIIAYEEPKGFGVRVDGSLSAGGEIHPGYDSLIAKLVCWGRDRDEAIDRMLRALGDFRIEGVPTTIPFDLRALANPVFRAGGATTTFIEEHPDVLPAPAPAAVTMNPDGEAAPAPASLLVEVGGHRFDVSVIGAPAPASARTEGAGRAKPRRRASAGTAVAAGAEKDLLSPIQGTVVRVAASDGQTVSRGALICVVEAMKMENEVTAHRDGTVRDLAVAVGEGIKVGSRIATID
jgi:acetyl-CoA/propionyl-CoA carboxylase biotin carboxyl carrier protein